MGHILDRNELRDALVEFNCDRNTEGLFHVDGDIASFLGMDQEFVIGNATMYYVNGKAYPLADALAHSDYGLQCMVIA